MINQLKKILKNKYVHYFLEFIIVILILILATGVLSSGYKFIAEHLWITIVLLIVIILTMGG
jgi:membrane protein YdbS with pleckstrin-like domain